jgi:FkbM family methyltransferase
VTAASLVKSALGRVGLVVFRRHHAAARYAEEMPANVFDDILLRLFPNLDGLHFIQIGANDGIRADPIRRHVLRHHWAGVLVEPQPTLFEQLRKNYADQPQLQFLNAAVDLHRGDRIIYFLQSGLTHLPDWAWGLGSFDRARLQTAAAKLGLDESAIASQLVPTVIWEDVLALFGPDPCDLLVVDAEGYDLTLLRAAPLMRWRPRLIHFEHSCASRADQLAFYSELISLGYEIATHAGDTIAWRLEQNPVVSPP